MLVLSRKSNESIVIGDQIVIEILEISNNKIRIGIAAPSNVRVVRGELTPKAPVPGRNATSTEKNRDRPNRPAASKTTGKIIPAQNSHVRNSGNNRPVNALVKERPLDRPLDRLRRSVVGGSGDGGSGVGGSGVGGSVVGGSANPNVRTVADEARHRLRQLRQQIHQEVANLDPIDSEPVGQGVAEPASPYQVRPLRQSSQKRHQYPTTCSSDDRTAQLEVYWQVEALNQYRGEWVAEEHCWYEASVATA